MIQGAFQGVVDLSVAIQTMKNNAIVTGDQVRVAQTEVRAAKCATRKGCSTASMCSIPRGRSLDAEAKLVRSERR